MKSVERTWSPVSKRPHTRAGMTTKPRQIRTIPKLPRRACDAHKGAFGRALVVGGSRGMVGAPSLVANSALRSGAGLVTVAVPAEAPDKIASVVALQVKGELDIEAVVPTQRADGTVVLQALDALLHGSKIKYESGHDRDNIGFWIDPADWVEWKFAVKQPGAFTVTAEIAATGSGSFEIAVGDAKLRATAPKTGDYGKFQTVELGKLEIPAAGKVSLAVRAIADGDAALKADPAALERHLGVSGASRR